MEKEEEDVNFIQFIVLIVLFFLIFISLHDYIEMLLNWLISLVQIFV